MGLLDLHLAQHALRRPAAEAVSDGRDRLTWAELDARVERVAGQLEARGVRPGQHVLVCMKRSVHTLAALLGVLRAGAAYVPLEPRTPAVRRQQIAADCQPAAVLCDAALAADLSADGVLARTAILVGDGDLDDAGTVPPPGGRAARGAPDDLACVLYTSGSTGRPKGVMLSHRNIDEYARWAVERIGIGAEDRVLGTAPFYFDMSLFDIFCAQRAGAALCIATERTLLFPKALVQFAEQESATVWKGVSSLLVYLSRTGAIAPERLPNLRAVLFGGEALPAKYLRDWMITFPGKVFFNFFGPTEATGASLYYRVPCVPPDAEQRIPIGVPRENTTLYLLGPDRVPVQDGEIGEIVLGGVCISRGYLHDPERTSRVFVTDPWRPDQVMYLTGDRARRLPDGNLVFLGRSDDQVKCLGYRLELTDIEYALTALLGVAEAGVLLEPAEPGGVEGLVAYVVLTGETSPAEVLAALKLRLPFYMLPRQILPIERLPRGERGKLDRHALEAQHRARSARP